VREPAVDRAHADLKALKTSLNQFGHDLLTTLSGEVSVTLNRLAITHAGAERRGLGQIVLENGPLAIRRRLKPILEAGRAAGLLAFEDSEEAYRSYFGLVVRDMQIRLLLGEEMRLSAARIEAEAATATEQFLRLYGAAGARD